MQKTLKLGAVLVTLALACTALRADYVEFKNSDRLTGKILSISGGRLRMETDMAGTITLDIAKIKTFQMDSAGEIHLPDGSVTKASIKPDTADGNVVIQQNATGKAEAIAVDKIKAINPPRARWDVSVSVGAGATRGNTNGESLTLSVNAVRDAKNDRLKFSGGYNFARREDPDTEKYKTSEDNWHALGQYDHFFSKHFYSYINTRVEKDRLANLDIRIRPGVGGGYQWLRTDKFNLSSEAGASYVHEDYREPDRKEDFTALRFAYDFDYRINGKAKFFHNTEYLPSTEDSATFLLNSEAGVRVKLNSHLFTELKVQGNYNSQPSDDDEKLDTKYTATVGLNF